VHDNAAAQPLTPEQQRIAQLECDLAVLRREHAALHSQLQDTEGALARLRLAYTRALEQLQLLRRRLFVAKAERADTRAEQLAFDAMFTQVHTLEKALEAAEQQTPSGQSNGDSRKDKPTRKPKGRRNLDDAALPEERVEILDPELEGRAERVGFEYSWRLGYQRGGMRRILVARAVYKDPDVTQTPSGQNSDPSAHFVRAPLPRELFRRGLLAPAMIAYVLCQKYLMGVPFYRLEQKFALEGVSLDRGTMCRYAEDTGATLGAIVEAARKEAFETAFCLSTDATGVSIQPGPLADRDRRPCRKGHFFVVLADRDHVFLEYQPKHTSAAVCEMFRGFSRYIQADAHAIYDALFRGTPPRGQPPDPQQGPPPTEVGCWSHCRRNFWEAAVCKHAMGVEGLRRIDAIFAADALLADLSPAQRKAQRQLHVRPLVDAFFTWVHAESARPRERGLVATALGYARNQEQPLRRFLEDGRLKMDNNASERALRASIAVGRKAWLFFGSDDHAQAAGNLFSLIASCKLHRLDPESYLTDVIRVMPYWPRERYLELTPKHWARTRARLDATEMDKPLGPVTVPPSLPSEEQGPTN
jgi:transposase